MDPHLYDQQMASYMLLHGYNPCDPNQVVYFNRMVQQPVQQPVYAGNRTGPPVNVTAGCVLTEARGIFVGNLHFGANEEAISNHFKSAGTIVKIDLQRDHQTKRSKGKCTIHFDSVRSAQNAIARFNNQRFMDMRLHVRLDKEVTAIDSPSAGSAPPQPPPVRGAAPPVIVSSTPKQICRVATRLEGQR